MTAFLLGRFARALLTLWAVLTLVFVLIHATGDPIAVLAPEQMNAAERAALAASLGLDRPLLVQYLRFIVGVLHGNLGFSYYSGVPALPLLAARVPVTLELVALAILIAVAVGVPLGIAAALRPESVADRALRGLSVLGASVPTFFLGIVLIFFFSVETNLLPASGAGGLRHFIMPAFTLAFFRIAFFTRLVRSALLESLAQPYVRTARAKGLSEAVVVLKHALRPAALPLVTVFGLQFGQLFAGTVITETIFALPGMNRLALEALFRLDYPIILSYVLVAASMFVALNFATDVLYGVIDPRVRHAR
ncbi:MAG TPA: ABC transporter permease [Acetobacteraceae bacterium]|nr:ABC transporter permease [Acetobacteraceae bacterium]